MPFRRSPKLSYSPTREEGAKDSTTERRANHDRLRTSPYGPYSDRPNVFVRNGAIWPRVLGFVGQKLPPPHPAAIPRPERSSIQSEKRPGHGTSPKSPVQAGGTYVEPSSVRSRNTAICCLSTGAFGQ